MYTMHKGHTRDDQCWSWSNFEGITKTCNRTEKVMMQEPDTYLVTAKNMDHNKYVCYAYHPFGVLEIEQHIVLDAVAKGPIAHNGNREVAVRHQSIRHVDTTHVGLHSQTASDSNITNGTTGGYRVMQETLDPKDFCCIQGNNLATLQRVSRAPKP